MKKHLLVLFILSTFITYAQNDSEKEIKPIVDGNLITFNTLTPLTFYAPRYQLGYIHSINKRWKFGADFGYGNDAITFDLGGDFESEDYRLFEVRAEAYYMLQSKGKWNQYLSAELFLISHQETFFNDSYRANDELSSVRYDSADYTRIKQGVNIKYGAFFNFSDKVGINFYYGFGVRVRDNKFENLTGFEVVELIDDELGFNQGFRRQQGRRVGLNIALGLKFYYKL